VKSTRDRAIRLARQAVRLPAEDRVLVVMALVGEGDLLTKIDTRRLKAESHDKIRTYRATWYPGLPGNSAAREIDKDLQTYAGGEWRQHRFRYTPPDNIDARRRALFEILKCGPAPRYEALRKILRG
jgi:hypothetical protein